MVHHYYYVQQIEDGRYGVFERMTDCWDIKHLECNKQINAEFIAAVMNIDIQYKSIHSFEITKMED